MSVFDSSANALVDEHLVCFGFCVRFLVYCFVVLRAVLLGGFVVLTLKTGKQMQADEEGVLSWLNRRFPADDCGWSVADLSRAVFLEHGVNVQVEGDLLQFKYEFSVNILLIMEFPR
jgi:hypothetical protein